MGKGALVAVLVAIVIAVGAGAYVLNSRKATTSPTSTSNQDSMIDTGSGPANSLRGLLGLGVNQMCTFQDAETQDEGTVYVSDNRVRGDFTTQSNGNLLVSHMIIEGDIMYVWMDGAEDGFMMDTVSEVQESDQDDTATANTNAPDLDKPVDYSCSSWAVDNSVFVRPANVNFESFSGMMEDTMSDVQDSMNMDTSDQCAACNNLPAGDAQDQCLTALNCN